ncbi:MAG: 50S ribosomal protein L29 [Spirochaetaceae bacterium]|nr:50S ribosomal protein L29 [Spirochaetaceae bacterium]
MAKKVDLKSMTKAELIVKRDEMKRKYMDLRFQMVLGHVENPMMKKTMRREIARLNTFIRQKEIAEQAK